MLTRMVVLAASSIAIGCQSIPATGSSDAESAMQAWLTAFNSCDADKASALYAPDAVLWGTVAPAIISTPTGVRQYFERVCSSTPKPKVQLGEQRVRVYGDTAINSGAYTFTVFPAGQPVQFPARFSFTYLPSVGPMDDRRSPFIRNASSAASVKQMPLDSGRRRQILPNRPKRKEVVVTMCLGCGMVVR